MSNNSLSTPETQALIEANLRETGIEKGLRTEVRYTLIPAVVRLTFLTKKIREARGKKLNFEQEKEELKSYLIDSKAKIKLFQEIIKSNPDLESDYKDSLESIKDWEKLFAETTNFYFESNQQDFESEVSQRILELEQSSQNPKKINQGSYRDRLTNLLRDKRFKNYLQESVNVEAVEEFLEVTNEFNLYKLINLIQEKIVQKKGDKEFSYPEINLNQIKSKILEILEKADQIKQAHENNSLEELRRLDQEIKKLLSEILIKITLRFSPVFSDEITDTKKGTSLSESLVKKYASCGGFSEIIRLISKYIELDGNSTYYPGHVNYEIELPSGDILSPDANGNFDIDPTTGETRTERTKKYYKTLRRVGNFSDLSEDEKSIAYRRIDSNGEILYYLPSDGQAFPILQFGRTSSKELKIPQAVLNNLIEDIIRDDLKNGPLFVIRESIKNNPYGLEINSGIEGLFQMSPEDKQIIFQEMATQDPKIIYTLQSFGFLRDSLEFESKIKTEEKIKLLEPGIKFLEELKQADPKFFIYFNLYTNLCYFKYLLYKEQGNLESIKDALRLEIESYIKIYEEEINKTESDSKLQAEYESLFKTFRRTIRRLSELLNELN